MLGLPASWLPVWKKVIAGSWLIASVNIERIMHQRSAWRAMLGIRSLNHIPLSPCWAKGKIEGATGKLFWPLVIVVSRWPWRIDSGRSSPRRFASPGLGSKRSICEGAPDWNRWMIRFAFGA